MFMCKKKNLGVEYSVIQCSTIIKLALDKNFPRLYNCFTLFVLSKYLVASKLLIQQYFVFVNDNKNFMLITSYHSYYYCISNH